MVQPDLSVPGHPEVFVVGDLANLAGPDGKPLPGVAQVAMQGGEHAAKMIARTLRGEPRTPFRYRDKGSMATIGRRAAVLQGMGMKMKGWFAWMAWLLIHILFLIGFRNRLVVLMQWAWSYLTWQRGARLITGEVGADLAPPGKPLGTPEGAEVPPSEGDPMSHDVQRAADAGADGALRPRGHGVGRGGRAPGRAASARRDARATASGWCAWAERLDARAERRALSAPGGGRRRLCRASAAAREAPAARASWWRTARGTTPCIRCWSCSAHCSAPAARSSRSTSTATAAAAPRCSRRIRCVRPSPPRRMRRRPAGRRCRCT